MTQTFYHSILEGTKNQKVVENFSAYLREFDVINISIITYYEILGGLKFKKAERQIKEFEEFVANNNHSHFRRISKDIW